MTTGYRGGQSMMTSILHQEMVLSTGKRGRPVQENELKEAMAMGVE